MVSHHSEVPGYYTVWSYNGTDPPQSLNLNWFDESMETNLTSCSNHHPLQ